MATYVTPGVYFETADLGRGGLTAIRTDIAAFVGLAERGPLHTPWPVQSFRQYQSLFGGYIGGGYLAYSVKAFFENGGRRCYVVRVAAPDATAAAGVIPGVDGAPTLRIAASSPGRWGDFLQVRLTFSRAEATHTTGPQPAGGAASVVQSALGFAAGTLVRLFQKKAASTVTACHVVAQADFAARQISWRRPLPVAPPEPFFDLSQPIELETVSYTLTVYERGEIRALYPDLSPSPWHARYAPRVINAQAEFEDRRPPPLIAVEDLHAGDPAPVWADWLPDVTAVTDQFSRSVLSLQCGTDGMANLRASDFIGQEGAPLRNGLRTLELVEEVSLVAIPDILIQPAPPVRYQPLPTPEPDPCFEEISPPPPPPPSPCANLPPESPPVFSDQDILLVQQALVDHCWQQGDRFALLDAPPEPATVFDPSRVLNWRRQFDTSYAALYYPWVLVPDPLQSGDGVVRAVPPSGHVAGLVARTDLGQGVHYAPANGLLSWAQGFTVPISAEWQGVLNPQQVNCLRSLPGRGLRLYGARTLSSDTALLFVNVRRLLLMIRKAIALSLQWTVLEPHDFYLRQMIILAVSSFLAALWQRGALVGETAEDAFFVRCDETNNPPDQVDLGQLVVDVGVAPVRPAEFVIVRIGRTENELQITELIGLHAT